MELAEWFRRETGDIVAVLFTLYLLSALAELIHKWRNSK